jgi:hypothetical protein
MEEAHLSKPYIVEDIEPFAKEGRRLNHCYDLGI